MREWREGGRSRREGGRGRVNGERDRIIHILPLRVRHGNGQHETRRVEMMSTVYRNALDASGSIEESR